MDDLFNVQYSLFRDLGIYSFHLNRLKETSYGRSNLEMAKKRLPLDLVNSVMEQTNNTQVDWAIINYWSKHRTSADIQKYTDNALKFDKFLNENSDQVIKPLESVYPQPYPFKKVSVFLTTFYKCSYWYPEKWFNVYAVDTLEHLLEVALHELNHFMFYYYYKEQLIQKSYSENQIEILKEALVVTSNPDDHGNDSKVDVLPLQKFIFENRQKPIDKIIELVINQKLLENL